MQLRTTTCAPAVHASIAGSASHHDRAALAARWRVPIVPYSNQAGLVRLRCALRHLSRFVGASLSSLESRSGVSEKVRDILILAQRKTLRQLSSGLYPIKLHDDVIDTALDQPSVALEKFIDRLFEANFAGHVLGAFLTMGIASLLYLVCRSSEILGPGQNTRRKLLRRWGGATPHKLRVRPTGRKSGVAPPLVCVLYPCTCVHCRSRMCLTPEDLCNRLS